MGYHVHILRTKNGVPDPILEKEILYAISSDTALHFTGNSIERGNQLFLSYSKGQLWLKNPEERDLMDMVSIAEKIGARVRGDEFETYTPTGETYIHPDDEKQLSEAQKLNSSIKRATKRRQYLLNFCIFTIFIILAMVANHFS